MKIILLLIALIITLPKVVYSQWEHCNNVLNGGHIYSIAFSENNFFAGTGGGGVFLSTDNGTSWSPKNSGLTDLWVRALVISGNNIFAGTGGGVFLSTNNGNNWTEQNSGLTKRGVLSIAISGNNIFVGTFSGGVFWSNDNGNNWEQIGLTNFDVNSIVINGNNIFAGTGGNGVYLSTDNGGSWIAKNTGLTKTGILSLAISGNNIFAGTSGGGVFISTNNGNTWTEKNSGLTNVDISSFAISGNNIFAGTNGGGIFLTLNNGNSWTEKNSGLPDTVFINSFATNLNNIFVGTWGNGVFKAKLSDFDILDTVQFVFEPAKTGVLNNQYTYNGQANATSGREVRYHLDQAPQGMSVNPLSGIVTWIPTQIGRFYVSLKAYVYVDSTKSYSYKNFYIQIRSCSEETYLKGTVKDSKGISIKQGNITIHNDSGIDSVGIYYGTIRPDGTFIIKLDEGNCKTSVDGEGFISQWYNNKSSKDSASVVPCPCGDTTDLNIIVSRTPTINLSITSIPSNTSIVGSNYTYSPVVSGNQGRALRYILISKPTGMTINNSTGVIQWNPPGIAGFRIILKAYLYTDSANSFVLQEWWLKVRSCSDDTYVSGSVKDENNNPVASGTVRVVSQSGIDSLGYYLGTISGGNYNVLIDEGISKIYVEGPTFRGEWYQDKASEQTATAVNAPCGATTTANFTVKIFTDYLISGKVIDEVTSNPIVNAVLYFQGTAKLDSTTTNQAGDYSIIMNEKFSYLAWATVPQNPLYITQYYNLTGNITEATPVEFSGDLSNINFALKSTSLSDNRMYGTVKGVQGEPIKSIILNFTIFPFDTSISSMFDARTYLTDVDGNYEFLNLAEGDYLLQAIPYSERYVPGYFKKDSTAVPSWVDASMIKIISGEQSGPHIITLPSTLPTSGKGVISGIITGEKLPIFLKHDESPLALEAVSGAVVITVDKDEKVRKYNLSNSKGVYRLDSLEAGDYNVSIDKLGYGPYSFDITIDPDNQTHNSDAELDIQIPVGVLDDLTNFTNYFRIYPNPSDGQFNIHSDIDLSGTDMLLTNLFGQPIFIQVIELNNYLYTLNIKADDVSQGLFFLRIVNNGISYFRTVVILK